MQTAGGSVRIRPGIIPTLVNIAEIWATRATCPRARNGAVIATEDGRILSSGYNGAPVGIDHCDRVGCIIDGSHCVRSVHAEMNAIIWAARVGIRLEGSTLVCTMRPCLRCAIAVIQVGIERVIYVREYESDDGPTALHLLHQAGIETVKYGGIE